MNSIQIALLGVVGTLLALQFKSGKSEYGIYVSLLLKMAGVTYVAEFASGICKDAGYQNIAVQIEIFTKLTILAIGMPVLLALLELIGDFLI